MTFTDYLKNHYGQACAEQNKIESDQDIVCNLANGSPSNASVRKWMESYNLFQGIEGGCRDAISQTFLKFTANSIKSTPLDREAIRSNYSNLFEDLYDTLPRSWMSATSKLLWCIYPSDIAIYDSFVHRTLLVLQHFDADLASLPHLSFAPQMRSIDDIENATTFYMQYQDMVKHLLTTHQSTLDNLRNHYNELYPYDIRVVDKLLWMIGSGNEKFRN